MRHFLALLASAHAAVTPGLTFCSPSSTRSSQKSLLACRTPNPFVEVKPSEDSFNMRALKGALAGVATSHALTRKRVRVKKNCYSRSSARSGSVASYGSRSRWILSQVWADRSRHWEVSPRTHERFPRHRWRRQDCRGLEGGDTFAGQRAGRNWEGKIPKK